MLAIDQGNSSAKLAWFDLSGNIIRRERLEIDRGISRTDFLRLLSEKGVENGLYEAAYLSSVVPELTPLWVELAHVKVIDNSWELPIKAMNKETSGTDRLMAAVAAADKKNLPAIIVSFGTATVVDGINENGDFIGGMIAPGIITAIDALGEKASQLFGVYDIDRPQNPFGADTLEALKSGIFYHTLGSVTAMIKAVGSAFEKPPVIYLTGGMAEKIAPHLPVKAAVDKDLVLRGIYLTANYKGL